MLRILSRSLDLLYRACGAISAAFLLLLLGVICVQVIARWTGYAAPGTASYAGYCMATASFLAIAYTLRRGAHIRVNLLLTLLGSRRRIAEVWCLLIASVLMSIFAWYAVRGTYYSWVLGDVSQDQDATPLWIPQIAMSAGAIVAAVAFIDCFVRALFTGRTAIEGETVRGAEG